MSNKNRQRTYNYPPKKELLSPQVWEVWLATVPYENDYSAKRRPVVVVDVKSAHFEALGMTSRPPEYSDEFYLSDWKRVGLKQRSTVKTRRIVKLSHRMFIIDTLAVLFGVSRQAMGIRLEEMRLLP